MGNTVMVSGATLAIVATVVAIVGGIFSSMAATCGAIFFLWKVSANVATSQSQLREVVSMVKELHRERLPERVAVLEAVVPKVVTLKKSTR